MFFLASFLLTRNGGLNMSKKYWEWKKPFDLKKEETALIIVDMQKGFVDEGAALEVPMARAQLPTITKVMKYCEINEIPVFLSKFEQDKGYAYDFYWKKNKERGLLKNDGSCKFARNSDEAQLCDDLSSLVSANDFVFPKYGYDCFAHTSLELELKRKHIKTVIIVGTVVNWCVDSTVRSAYHKDYNVVVLSDCVSGYNHAGATGEKWVEMELDLFGEGFARVMSSEDVISEMDSIKSSNEMKKISNL